ncbi:hypothetical protein AB9M62_39795 [Bacillales bacterium AN1005]
MNLMLSNQVIRTLEVGQDAQTREKIDVMAIAVSKASPIETGAAVNYFADVDRIAASESADHQAVY